ncbi:MAG: hypothetical protein ACR2H3_04970 [Acidimicrobiales bacterium]
MDPKLDAVPGPRCRVFAAALALVATAACGPFRAQEPSAAGGDPGSPAVPVEVPVPSSVAHAPTVLDFTAPLVGGGTFDAGSTAGTDLAVWFWSPW